MRHLWFALSLPILAPAALAAQQGDTYTVVHPTELRAAPDATPLGQLRGGATVEILARDRGWVRVRTEGWVREADLAPADTALSTSLSAADLRADPDGTRGKVVQWTVEFLALQTADPLRQGMADQEPYMLVRGPGSENAIVYLVIPPSLMNIARTLQPLSKVIVVARVREGRSAPLGIPILDVRDLRRVK